MCVCVCVRTYFSPVSPTASVSSFALLSFFFFFKTVFTCTYCSFQPLSHFLVMPPLSDTITSHPLLRLPASSNLRFTFAVHCLRASWCKAHAFHKAHYAVHRVFT